MNTPTSSSAPFDAKAYFQLVDEGLLAPDDRVELLEGLIVSMSPQMPGHAATVWQVTSKLTALVGMRAMVRCQLPLLAGDSSVPEPDVAVVPCSEDGWQFAHPDRCYLAVEVADSSLAQDRLTKSRIYAAAGVDDYWIVNLRSRQVEWFSAPDPKSRVYAASGIATGAEPMPATGFDLQLTAEALFPPRSRATGNLGDQH